MLIKKLNLEFNKTIFIVSILVLIFVSLRGIEMFDDTNFYLSAMLDIQNKTPIYEEDTYTHQVIPLLNNPGTILLSVALSNIFGSELGGLRFINMTLYVATALIFYNLALLVFRRRDLAIFSSIFFMTNYAMIRFGAGSYLVDMPGWFFYVLSLYLALKFFYTQDETFVYLTGASSMLGVFFKENGGIGIFALGIFILISQRPIKDKVILILKSGSFLLINFGYHIWAYLIHGYLYFNRYETVIQDFAPLQSTFRTLKVLGYFFNMGWPFAFLGFLKATPWKISAWNDYHKALLGLLPSSLIFLAYPAYDQRIAFVAAPLLCLLAVFGIQSYSKKTILIIIFTYIACNIYLIHKLSLPDISI